MKTSKLIYYLQRLFPRRYGEKKDFIGLQVGQLRSETKCIVLCLDFDWQVWHAIKKQKVDLILTHHPFIYGQYNEVLKNDPLKKKLVTLINQKKIPVYSLHTNFDSAPGGMNDVLAQKLRLKNIKPLINQPMLRGGELVKPMLITDLAQQIKNDFHLPYLLFINGGVKKIHRVAVCSGSGSSFFRFAQKEKYDLFCSSDPQHHIRHAVNEYKYNLLFLPHESEKIFMNIMYTKLQQIDNHLKIIMIDNQTLPTLI